MGMRHLTRQDNEKVLLHGGIGPITWGDRYYYMGI